MSMNIRTTIIYACVAVIVVLLGALSGWYFFLRGQTQATTSADAARGFSTGAPFGSPTGSTYQNMLSDISGGAASSGASSGKALPQLWHADKAPVAGFAFSAGTTSTDLSYVERSTGYVFSAAASMQTITRRTNTLLPKIYEAYFDTAGGVIERGVDGSGAITTFAGRLSTTTTAGATSTAVALSGSYLDTNILALATNAVTGSVFYLESGTPRVVGLEAQWDGSKRSTVFSSAIADWRATWLSDGRVILLMAPTDGVVGYAYALQSDGSLAPLVGPVLGLTVAPRSSASATTQSLLYGQSTGSGLTLFAQVNAQSAPVALPIHTVADKCVWAPGANLIAYCAVPQVAPAGNFLDDWYKGLAHTADALWRVDVSAGTVQLVYAPSSGLALDVEDPVIDASGAYIAFRDKTDGSLWVLRLQK